MKTHELKVITRFWPSVVDGTKPFEVRRNDRGFTVGDLVKLCEYDATGIGFTGNHLVRKIGFILYPEDMADISIKPGYVVLGLVEPQLEKMKRLVSERIAAKQSGDKAESWALKLEINAMLTRKPVLRLGYGVNEFDLSNDAS